MQHADELADALGQRPPDLLLPSLRLAVGVLIVKCVNESDKERFWKYVERTNDCWLWRGARVQGRRGYDNYGQFWVNGGQIRVHRYSFIIHYGAIPNGLCICHSCDTPLCVNPAHLFAWTHAQNMQDCAKKGRHSTMVHPELRKLGEKHPNAKLTTEKVTTIRHFNEHGMSHAEIARMFVVSESLIRQIVRRQIWKHV